MADDTENQGATGECERDGETHEKKTAGYREHRDIKRPLEIHGLDNLFVFFFVGFFQTKKLQQRMNR